MTNELRIEHERMETLVKEYLAREPTEVYGYSGKHQISCPSWVEGHNIQTKEGLFEIYSKVRKERPDLARDLLVATLEQRSITFDEYLDLEKIGYSATTVLRDNIFEWLPNPGEIHNFHAPWPTHHEDGTVTYTLWTRGEGSCKYCHAADFGMRVLRTAKKLAENNIWEKYDIKLEDKGNVVTARMPILYIPGHYRIDYRGETIVLREGAKQGDPYMSQKIHNITGYWPAEWRTR